MRPINWKSQIESVVNAVRYCQQHDGGGHVFTLLMSPATSRDLQTKKIRAACRNAGLKVYIQIARYRYGVYPESFMMLPYGKVEIHHRDPRASVSRRRHF